MRIGEVLIMDLEASGLGAGSWPIEVGLSWVEAGEVRSWSSLIRPEPDWDEGAWSLVSQDVHGIGREELDTAPSAWSVAEELLARVAGRPVFSDAPEFDMRWARRLLDAQPSPVGLRVLELDQAIGAVCGAQGADWAYERLERSRTPYRAGPDAEPMLPPSSTGLSAPDPPAMTRSGIRAPDALKGAQTRTGPEGPVPKRGLGPATGWRRARSRARRSPRRGRGSRGRSR